MSHIFGFPECVSCPNKRADTELQQSVNKGVPILFICVFWNINTISLKINKSCIFWGLIEEKYQRISKLWVCCMCLWFAGFLSSAEWRLRPAWLCCQRASVELSAGSTPPWSRPRRSWRGRGASVSRGGQQKISQWAKKPAYSICFVFQRTNHF